jgi:hypothetical protein
MKASRYLAVPAVALLLATAGCDEGLTDVNINPNEPEVVPAQNVLANALVTGVGGSWGTHGIWSGFYLLNMWAQHLSAPTYQTEDQYGPRDDQVTSIWDHTYINPLPDLQSVRQLADDDGLPNLGAVADVFTQYLFQYLTDIYGDIPYSEALQAPAIPQPRYDPQQQVYEGMLAALAAAAGRMDRADRGLGWAPGDVIYGGNMEQWYRFANSLRMRMAMRTVNVAPDFARDQFVAAYNAGVFRNNADNARVIWAANPPHQNPRHNLFFNLNRRDQVLSAALVNRLQAVNDPRLTIYAAPAPEDGGYRGLPNGMHPDQAGLREPQLSPPGAAFLAATTTPEAARWITACRPHLTAWRDELTAGLAELGLVPEPGDAPFVVVPVPDVEATAQRLRDHHGVKVRVASSLGRPGAWRIAAQPPEAQRILLDALAEVLGARAEGRRGQGGASCPR